jgi:hypothetical protein
MRKEAVVLFNVLSQYFHGGVAVKHKKPQDSECHGRDSNPTPPEYSVTPHRIIATQGRMCFHGGQCSDCGILVYDTVQSGRRRNTDDVLTTWRHNAGTEENSARANTSLR